MYKLPCLTTSRFVPNRAFFSSYIVQNRSRSVWPKCLVVKTKNLVLRGLHLKFLLCVGHVVRCGLVLAGTGSGIGTKVLEVLQDGYPEVYRWVHSVSLAGDGWCGWRVLQCAPIRSSLVNAVKFFKCTRGCAFSKCRVYELL